MSDIQFESGQILFDSGAIAMHADCCCLHYSLCSLPSSYDIKLDFSDVEDCPIGDCDWLHGQTYICTWDDDVGPSGGWIYEYDDHKVIAFCDVYPGVGNIYVYASDSDNTYACFHYMHGWDPGTILPTNYYNDYKEENCGEGEGDPFHADKHGYDGYATIAIDI